MLSEEQKYEILRLLGYPLGSIDPGSSDYSNIVTKRLNAINGGAQAQVEKVLSWIDETETQIDAILVSQRVKRVEDIEFFENPGTDLRSEKNRYITQLATMLQLRNMNGCGSNFRVIV